MTNNMRTDKDFFNKLLPEIVHNYKHEKGFFSRNSQAMDDLITGLKADALEYGHHDYSIDVNCFTQPKGSHTTFNVMHKTLSSYFSLRFNPSDVSYDNFKKHMLYYLSQDGSASNSLPVSVVLACVYYSNAASVNQHQLKAVSALLLKNALDFLSDDQAQTDRDAILAAGANAYFVADALRYANQSHADLLSGDQAQANRNAIVAAGVNAQAVAYGLERASLLGLLSGTQAQTNRDTILAAGANAQVVSTALFNLDNPNLLLEANRDAILAAGPNASFVAYALKDADRFGLLSGDQAQANRDTILAAGVYASKVAEVLHYATCFSLLSGAEAQVNRNAIDALRHNAKGVASILEYSYHHRLLEGDQKQANFSAIVAAGDSAEAVASALARAHNLGLLKGDQKQANFNALIACSQHAYTIAKALAFATSAPRVLTDFQPFFKRLLRSFSEKEHVSERRYELYHCLRNYPLLKTAENLTLLPTLTETQAHTLTRSIEKISAVSVNLLTLEWYDFLLNLVTKPGVNDKTVTDCVAAITGYCVNAVDFASNSLIRHLQSELALTESLTKDHFAIYRHFSKTPHLLDLTTLKGLLQLSADEANRLLTELKRDRSSAPIASADRGVIGAILLERDTLAHLRVQLPPEIQHSFPAAHDAESSMRDELIHKARQQVEDIAKEFGITSVASITDASLEKIEKGIRRFLLREIQAELKSDLEAESHKENPAGDCLSQLSEKIAFIDTNFQALMNRSDLSLIAKAVGYFASNESVAEIAWRAYEPTAITVSWPNLLTAPTGASSADTVFSNRASNSGSLTHKQATDEVRRWSAICFQSAMKYPQMQEGFKYALAEIRRAHNYHKYGVDNPSCQPGTLSRFLTVTGKHPKFAVEPSPKHLKTVVAEQVQSRAQRVLNKLSEGRSGSDARLLLCAMSQFSKANKNALLKDKKNSQELFLYATDSDLAQIAPEESDEEKQIAAWMKAAKAVANEFLSALCGSDNTALYNDVVATLTQLGISHTPSEVNYWIANTLADIGKDMSWPRVLMVAMHGESMPEREEMAIPPFQVELSEILRVNAVEVPDGVIEELSDKLSNMIARFELSQGVSGASSSSLFRLPPISKEQIDRAITDALEAVSVNTPAMRDYVISAMMKLPGAPREVLQSLLDAPSTASSIAASARS